MSHEELKRQYAKDAEISTTPHPPLLGSSSMTTQHGKPATKRLSGQRTTSTDATRTPT